MCLNPFVKISPTSIDCITNITKTINYTYYMMGNIQNKKYRYSYDSRNRLLGESIYLGSTPIAMSTTTKTYKIYTDHLNTPRRVADETNNIVWKWESTPFGETKPIGTLKFNLRFAGQYFDNETATHYNINRDYNPVTGRYIQSDPIGLDGGFSTFAYVNGNPVMRIDKNGLVDMNFIPNSNIYTQGSFVLDAYHNYVANPDLYAAGEAFNHDTLFTVLAHTEVGMLFDKSGNRMTKSVLDDIAERAKASGNNAIWLIACHGGTDDYIYYPWGRKDVSTARYLANKSGMNVIAINKYIYFGYMFPFPTPENSAKWSTLYPEK